jgi:NADPH2:quinone reductase
VRAVLLREVDGPLTVEELDEPAGEAVVAVRAAGVNFADILIRRGRYPQMPALPFVPGSEVAGDLDGRRVVALARMHGGGYATRAAVDPTWVFDLPVNATYAEGAAFLLTYLTAQLALGDLRVGAEQPTVLVHAGAGGVGTAAIQLARHRGAHVIATASSEPKRTFALEVGADEARAYEDLDGVEVDLVVDPVGGEVFDRSLRLVRPLGGVAAVGYAGGAWNPLDPALLVGRNIRVCGVYLGRLMRLAPAAVRSRAAELLALWESGAIRPVVGATFSLEEAERAHALIEAREHVGKVVLQP